MSDIAGQDIDVHENRPGKVIGCVRTWLRSNTGRTTIPGAGVIRRRYEAYSRDLPKLLRYLGITKAEIRSPEYYGDYIETIRAWLKQAASR